MGSIRAGRAAATLAATLFVLGGPDGVARASPHPGFLDHSFHGTGRTIIPLGEDAEGLAVARQGHKIVVAGERGGESTRDLVVIRLRANGVLDRTFGGGDGIFAWNVFGDADLARAVSVLPNGKILVAGQAFDDSAMIWHFVVLRLTPNGRPDLTFGGGDGYVTTGFGGIGASGTAMTVLPDGRFLVCGYTDATNPSFALARYRPGGGLDGTFGTNGMVTTSFPGEVSASCSALTHVGNQVVAVGHAFDGVSTNSFAAARYRADGTLDPVFSGDGLALFDPLPPNDQATGVVSLPDGKVVIAGWVVVGSPLDVALVQVKRNGALDPTFGGGDGIVVDDLGSVDEAAGLLRQPDGKLILVGFRNPDMFVARYRPLGGRDVGFAHRGVQARPWSGPSAAVAAVLDHGKVVAAGSELTGGGVSRFAVERLFLG